VNPDMTVKRLVLLRRMWNLDQKSMANAIGVSHRTWQRIEYADTRITVDVLFKLAKLFQVSPGFFVEPCVPLNEPWICLNCDYYTNRISADASQELRTKIIPLIETWLPALDGNFREAAARPLPICEISLETFYMNQAAQKRLNLPLAQYSLCDMFHNKTKIALLFERLLGDAPGKRFALCAFKPRFAASGSRSFIQLLRLQKRSWDNPRFLSVIVDAGPLEKDLMALDLACGHNEFRGQSELSILLHPLVD
jgi:transcriptional regulator with XRE-family HTH domain